MLIIKDLTVKNFMSVGNAIQAIKFDNKHLILVLGENMDLGGDDAGARNGTGKTTIINALSYVFFGEALTHIRRDNLVNKTNNKDMIVVADTAGAAKMISEKNDKAKGAIASQLAAEIYNLEIIKSNFQDAIITLLDFF